MHNKPLLICAVLYTVQTIHGTRYEHLEAVDIVQEGHCPHGYLTLRATLLSSIAVSNTRNHSLCCVLAAAVNNELLRRHFLERTEKFLIPLQRYFTSLMPLQKYLLATIALYFRIHSLVGFQVHLAIALAATTETL